LNNKQKTDVLIYISVFVFHFLILLLISMVVKERVSSVSEYQDVELLNIQEFKQQQRMQPRVEEGMKEETDDKAKPEQSNDEDSNYLGQFNAAFAPIFPNYLKSRIIYPPLAKQQGIQNVVVILDLFISNTGEIKKITVLKDPGYGFADAVVKGLQGVKVVPARDASGNPISIKFRWPFRFVLD
jgi:periplasmic protein TonB